MNSNSGSKQQKETASARGNEAVATPPAELVEATPAPVEQPVAAEPDTCADCGSEDVVVRTDDPAAEPKSYCLTHKPVNVPLPENLTAESPAT